MRLSCAQEQAQKIADLILEAFDPEDTAAAAFEAAAGAQSWIEQEWVVEAYFGAPPDRTGLLEIAKTVLGEDASARIEFKLVEQRDWVAASLEGLKPVRAGRFLVHGAHDRASVRIYDIGIEVEAALAFGTGHHGSTRGCLLLLDELRRWGRLTKILDIGTGSGILAIAAARLWKRKVEAGDIDAVCAASATANAKLNKVAAFVRPIVARGVEHITLQQCGPYDLILANILARPLRQMAPQLAKLAARGGRFILSGLLEQDAAAVLSAYRSQNIFLLKRVNIDGWVSLLLERRLHSGFKGSILGRKRLKMVERRYAVSKPMITSP